MRNKLLMALLVVFFLFQFYPVFAADTPQKIFALMDADKDGKVTKEEFMHYYVEAATKLRAARFDRLDKNGDGKITRDEYLAASNKEAEKVGARKFKRIDKDRDGVLSEEELKQRYNLVRESFQQLK